MRAEECAKDKKIKPSDDKEKGVRIVVRLEGHSSYYQISDVLRLFTGEIPKEEDGRVVCDATSIFPGREELFSEEGVLTILSRVSEEWVETVVEKENDGGHANSEGESPAVISIQSAPQIFIDRKDLALPVSREIKIQLYFLLSRLLKMDFPWGSLTGIRPTQVARELGSEEEMQEIIPGTTDASVEKHVPVFEVKDNKVFVTVGSVYHPMLPEHYIEWVSIQTKFGNQRKALKPGEEPKVCFSICEGDEVEAVFAYCNLHSLWKA